MPSTATVQLNHVPADVEEEILALGGRATHGDDADLVISAGPAPARPTADVLQFGGAIHGPLGAGEFVQEAVMSPHWTISPGAELLGLAEIAAANLLLDPPRSGMRWNSGTGATLRQPVTPLVTAASGHHAAMIVRRPGGGHLWWISENTLDYLPWVEMAMSYRAERFTSPEGGLDLE